MIRLFIENKEIELDEEVKFAITKQFEDLNDPTAIINDWSKTVSIPFTSTNHRIFGYIFNPDKLTVAGGDSLTGIYFDPLKKLDFRLLWGDAVLMTGYAKLNEVKQNAGRGSYDVTLFGQLGKVFQEMKKITFDTSYTNSDYIIDGSEYVDEFITKDLVAESWNSHGQTTELLETKTIESSGVTIDNPYYNVTDIIGFSPSNSFTENFDYNTIQRYPMEGETGSTIEDAVTDTYTNLLEQGFTGFPKFEDVTGIKPSTVIPNGMRPRGCGEFRSYLQLPYIYWNKLFQVFQKKAEDITGYEFELDQEWFDFNNPYYGKLVYMLKPFEAKDGGTSLNTYISKGHHSYADTSTATTVYEPHIIQDGNFCAYYGYSTLKDYWNAEKNIALDDSHMNKAETTETIAGTNMRLTLSPNGRVVTQAIKVSGLTEIYSGLAIQGTTSANIHNWECYYFNPAACLCVNVKYTGANGTVRRQTGAIYQGATDVTNQYVIDYANSCTCKATVNLYPERTNTDGSGSTNRYTGSIWDFELNFPETNLFYGEFGEYVDISLETYFWFPDNYTPNEYIPFGRRDVTVGSESYRSPDWSNKYRFATVLNFNSELRVTTGVFRSGSKFVLNDLWNNEYNLFDEILRYCKMYHIHVYVDDAQKKIHFLPYYKYFQNYTVKDWTKKIDKSKDFNITPITFEDKYVLFNYDEGKSKNEVAYKEKYGIEYGEYRVITEYNFNDSTKKLFSKQKPSIIITPAILSWHNLYAENTIIYIVPNEKFIEAEDKDGKTIDTFGQMYFYNGVQTFSSDLGLNSCYVSDDTKLMSWNQTYFYTGGYYGYNTSVRTFPYLSLTYGDNLITYAKPVELYSVNTSVDNAVGIYANFWNRYIDERYNAQNKKITCYVDLKPSDFCLFNFNQFVKVGQQLCIVNKIYDYDISSNDTTKVDLVTIQDLGAYTTNGFKYDTIVSDEKELTVPYDFYKKIQITATGNWELSQDNTDYRDFLVVYPESGNSGTTNVYVGSINEDGGYDLVFNLLDDSGNTLMNTTVRVDVGGSGTINTSPWYNSVYQGNSTTVSVTNSAATWSVVEVDKPAGATTAPTLSVTSGQAGITTITVSTTSSTSTGIYDYYLENSSHCIQTFRVNVLAAESNTASMAPANTDDSESVDDVTE